MRVAVRDSLQRALAVVKQTFAGARRHDIPRLSAALAFYALFSLAPIIVITVSVAGLLLRSNQIDARVIEEVNNLIGAPGAAAAKSIIASARRPANNVIALVASLPLLFFGASRVFAQLNVAMQIIWETRRSGIRGTILNRLIGGIMVVAAIAAFWLGVLVQGALASARAVAGGWWGELEVLLAAADWFTTFALSVLLIAIVLRYLPRTHVPWRAALAGAVLTAILFLIGRFVFGLYIRFGIASSFQGAAGSFVVVALWAYYVAQILFIGAEFTRAYMGGGANSSPPN